MVFSPTAILLFIALVLIVAGTHMIYRDRPRPGAILFALAGAIELPAVTFALASDPPSSFQMIMFPFLGAGLGIFLAGQMHFRRQARERKQRA